MQPSQLWQRLLLAAQEYTLFRNQMVAGSGTVTASQMLAALSRADKVAGLLTKLASLPIGAVQSASVPARIEEGQVFLASQPGVPPSAGGTWVCGSCLAHLVVMGPSGTYPRGPCPNCKVDLTPPVTPVKPTVTVWKCETCASVFQVEGNVPPQHCPQCKRKLR